MNDGGTAFPIGHGRVLAEGLSRLDFFSEAALTGLLAGDLNVSLEAAAEGAYRTATAIAMLAGHERPEKEGA